MRCKSYDYVNWQEGGLFNIFMLLVKLIIHTFIYKIR